jgi:hypothetical protein
VSKAEAYPSGAPDINSPLRYAIGINQLHYTRMERLARDKHYSLLGTFVLKTMDPSVAIIKVFKASLMFEIS